ncbi:hypothetical protein D3C73_1412560 [compost metagenome]
MILLFGLLGFGVCFASVGIRTTYQALIDPDKMGRVMSVLSMLGSCTIPLGTYAGSVLIEHWPIAPILLIYGMIVAVAGLSLILPFRKDLNRHSADSAAAAG